jgi:hypothetical protein
MPVQTHERLQASRGGLTGSDGSGWTLLAVRKKAQRRSVRVNESRRDRRRNGKGQRATDQSRGTAGHRAQVALVGSASVFMPATIKPIMRLRFCFVMVELVALVFRCLTGVLVTMMSMASVGCLNRCMSRRAMSRALHSSCERSPNRDEHCEQHEEPDTEGLHSC